MSAFIIKTEPNGFSLQLDLRKTFYLAGEVNPYTPDATGSLAYLYDNTGILENGRQRIEVDLAVDTVDVDGVTAFTNAGEFIQALEPIFFRGAGGGSGASNPNAAQLLFSEEVASLANGAEIDTGFLDFAPYSKQQITIVSGSVGLTFVQTLKAGDAGSERAVNIPLANTDNTFTVNIRGSQERIQIQNNSGAPITNVSLEIKAFIGGDGATVTRLDSSLVSQSQALLTRSFISGEQAGNSDAINNVIVNPSGALLTSDYGTELVQGKFPDAGVNKKYGRNSEVDISSAPEDVWNGGGLYTGFNCIDAQRLQFFSSSANDSGVLVTSGTATGGSTTTLIDAGATFITSGVLAGQVVIIDSQGFHGIVESVDSETQLTVFDYTNTVTSNLAVEAGDTYRIARATSTGAAVCKFSAMLDANYDEFLEYVIMNGVTPVLSVGSYLRQSEGQVVLSGSSLSNVGEIQGRQQTSTANVTMIMPAGSGRTAICCDTVPRGKNWIVKNIEVQMGRANGSAGSANMRFQTRKRGESWQTQRFPLITDSQEYVSTDAGGVVVTEFTDVRWNVQSVSDNDTTVSAEFEYFIVNKQ